LEGVKALAAKMSGVKAALRSAKGAQRERKNTGPLWEGLSTRQRRRVQDGRAFEFPSELPAPETSHTLPTKAEIGQDLNACARVSFAEEFHGIHVQGVPPAHDCLETYTLQVLDMGMCILGTRSLPTAEGRADREAGANEGEEKHAGAKQLVASSQRGGAEQRGTAGGGEEQGKFRGAPGVWPFPQIQPGLDAFGVSGVVEQMSWNAW